ncbi:Mono [ADP-ribose] polymerase PARP16 [Sciurus carolinensis]|uniref:Mono [ADP-ribose] polymerase PARP16 n=1 Tax=Sciurus carolinensis TaxID=30640 RepID=A0AA41SWD7_SCICA|nr:Mono [ADP-ribose] polymerase PARP16 [Sciurus carolinensis]
MQPCRVAAKEAAGRNMLAQDLRCSLFTASALQSYKRDLVLWPLPSSYTRLNSKDFEALLADASKLPNMKNFSNHLETKTNGPGTCAGKTEFEKIQQLTGVPHMPVPTPDFLFEIAYFEPANGKFYETKGERDLIYTFHSSHLENFHSIIHNDCTAT